MKKILTTLAVGVMVLGLSAASDAATGVRVGPSLKQSEVKVTTQSTYNVSIDLYNGNASSYYGSKMGSFKYSYTPSVNGEMGASFELLESSGYGPMNWVDNSSVGFGWYYGGANKLTADLLDWSDIVSVANNTRICPGRTQAIFGNGSRLAINSDAASIASVGVGYAKDSIGSSIVVKDQNALNNFYEQNKTTTSIMELVGSSVEYVYLDGVLTAVTKEVINQKNTDIYNLAIIKSVSPIVLDVSGSGKLQASKGQYLPHEGVDLKNTIIADFYGDGFEIAMEWVGPQDGLLVAPKADGTVDMSCLFGTAGGYDNGFEKLSLYADANGIVKGDALSSLAVWQDTNGNGIADAGEVKSCKELGITSISANHKMFVSSFEMNGKTQKMWDWWPSATEVTKIASK